MAKLRLNQSIKNNLLNHAKELVRQNFLDNKQHNKIKQLDIKAQTFLQELLDVAYDENTCSVLADLCIGEELTAGSTVDFRVSYFDIEFSSTVYKSMKVGIDKSIRAYTMRYSSIEIKEHIKNDEGKIASSDKYEMKNFLSVTRNNQSLLKKAVNATREYNKAWNKFQKEISKVEDAYKKLIFSSTYFDDIVAIWPEAEVLRPQPTNALVCISEQDINIIKQDMKNRKK